MLSSPLKACTNGLDCADDGPPGNNDQDRVPDLTHDVNGRVGEVKGVQVIDGSGVLRVQSKLFHCMSLQKYIEQGDG